MTGPWSDIGAAVEVILGARYARTYRPGNPAAGSDWLVPVPGGTRWRLHSVVAQLTTSAVVASRVVALHLGDGNGDIAVSPMLVSQAASLSYTYCWYPGAGHSPAASAGTACAAPLPSLMLDTAYTVSVQTAARDVGDQWSAITLHVEEYTTGPPPPRSVVETIGQG